VVVVLDQILEVVEVLVGLEQVLGCPLPQELLTQSQSAVVGQVALVAVLTQVLLVQIRYFLVLPLLVVGLVVEVVHPLALVLEETADQVVVEAVFQVLLLLVELAIHPL
jgi:hypothetical protein